MPKLIIFAVGKEVIVSRDTNELSVIGCLTALSMEIPKGEIPEEIPDNAVSPFSWGAGSIWQKLPADEGKKFAQKLEIIRPDGKSTGDVVTVFELTLPRHTVTNRGDVFPVWYSGEYRFRLSLQEKGSEEWVIYAEYPVQVDSTLNPSVTSESD